MSRPSGTRRIVAGRYELGRCLGQGGMGTVWLAQDSLLGREVAVKEITFPTSVSEQERRSLRERTLREARAAARFQHPRVTTVHDVVEEDGRPWIVMEHVLSRSLSEVLRANGPLPVARVARIGLDVLDALDAAHQAGIVHRDVKPANVLVSREGRAWLTDFGIATSSGEQRLTGQHVLLGSPAYIAPERARGDEPGPPADLWSLGATLYTAIEGRAPFERAEAMATLMAAATEDPPPARGAGALEPLVRAMLVRDPAGRPTADQVRTGLERALSSDQAPVAPVRPAARPAQPAAASSREQVQRLDVHELSALAAAAGRALAGSAAREVARRATSPQPAARPAPSASSSAQPAARPGQPASRSGRSTRGGPVLSEPPAGRKTWRFKRRWVGVPLLVLLLLVASVVGLIGLAGAALLGLV
ncbi:MAG: serine/threonine protein kinase [Frankiales bacterium]|nr:serine/threonine protein kinase [Frankiales bacterium]